MAANILPPVPRGQSIKIEDDYERSDSPPPPFEPPPASRGGSSLPMFERPPPPPPARGANKRRADGPPRHQDDNNNDDDDAARPMNTAGDEKRAFIDAFNSSGGGGSGEHKEHEHKEKQSRAYESSRPYAGPPIAPLPGVPPAHPPPGYTIPIERTFLEAFPRDSDINKLYSLGCQLASGAHFADFALMFNISVYAPAADVVRINGGLVTLDGTITDRKRSMEVFKWMTQFHPPAISWVAQAMNRFKSNLFSEYPVFNAFLIDLVKKPVDMYQLAQYAACCRSVAGANQRAVYLSTRARSEIANEVALCEDYFKRWER